LKKGFSARTSLALRNSKKMFACVSFDIVGCNENNTYYFRDRSNVYLKSNIAPDALLQGGDPNTFMVLNIEKGLSKDRFRITTTKNESHLTLQLLWF
jgi:DKNYY family